MNIEPISDLLAAGEAGPSSQCLGSETPSGWSRPVAVAQPETAPAVAETVRVAEADGTAIVPAGGSTMLQAGGLPDPDRHYILLTSAQMNRITDYQPDDLTVTCEPGVTLTELQRELTERHQFLAIDAPMPDRATIGGIVAANASGLWRPAYGSPRDLVIGLRAVISGGVDIKGGGKVVKNVAGYDVCKLFTGSWGTLGVLTEVTFKVRSLPQVLCAAGWWFSDISQAAQVGFALHTGRLAPAFVAVSRNADGRCRLIVGLHGTEERVAWQRDEVGRYVDSHASGARREDPEETEVSALRDRGAAGAPDAMVAARISDLPSRLGATAALLAALPDVSIDLHSASGIAIVSLRAAEPSTLRALVRLAPSDGCLAWLRMPESLAGDPALARPAREDSVLQHAIKTAIDPLGTFSPGRSVPGL